MAERGLDLGRGGRAGYGHRRHPELGGLAGQQVGLAAARGQRHHPEPAGIAPDDVERLGADRAGRAEDHDLARLAGIGFWPDAAGTWDSTGPLSDTRRDGRAAALTLASGGGARTPGHTALLPG